MEQAPASDSPARPRPMVHPGRNLSDTPGLNIQPVSEDTASSVGSNPGNHQDLQDAALSVAEPPADGTQGAGDQDGDTEKGLDRAYFEMHQRQRRSLLESCSRLQLLDFQLLAMGDWPENFVMTRARQGRDRWLFAMSILAVVFLAGVANLVPAWLAGTAFGALSLLGILGIPAARMKVSRRPGYTELLATRRDLIRNARKHIDYLEGPTGLAWQCKPLADYNPMLRQARFQNLFNLSQTGNLSRYIRARSHVRLYLMFLLEAEKAYDGLQTAYFDGQEEALSNGWDLREQGDEVTDPPA